AAHIAPADKRRWKGEARTENLDERFHVFRRRDTAEQHELRTTTCHFGEKPCALLERPTVCGIVDMNFRAGESRQDVDGDWCIRRNQPAVWCDDERLSKTDCVGQLAPKVQTAHVRKQFADRHAPGRAEALGKRKGGARRKNLSGPKPPAVCW